MTSRQVLYIAVAFAAVLVSVNVEPWPALSAVFAVVAGASFLLAVDSLVRPLLRRGKYDLGELQRVHEMEEMRALAEGVPDVDNELVFCSCCMSAYSAEFPTCPECGKAGRRR